MAPIPTSNPGLTRRCASVRKPPLNCGNANNTAVVLLCRFPWFRVRMWPRCGPSATQQAAWRRGRRRGRCRASGATWSRLSRSAGGATWASAECRRAPADGDHRGVARHRRAAGSHDRRHPGAGRCRLRPSSVEHSGPGGCSRQAVAVDRPGEDLLGDVLRVLLDADEQHRSEGVLERQAHEVQAR